MYWTLVFLFHLISIRFGSSSPGEAKAESGKCHEYSTGAEGVEVDDVDGFHLIRRDSERSAQGCALARIISLLGNGVEVSAIA
jgi:hypothetical protein